jgi:citrate lyase subunit beta/citryl-CoA lyase
MAPIDVAAARSCLCVPADDRRKLDRALSSAADQIVVDLEDAVAPDRKDIAREIAGEVLAVGHTRNVMVRINGLGTNWWHDDLTEMVNSNVHISGIVVPKAENASELNDFEIELRRLETGGRRLEVHLLIESARGLLHLDQLLEQSERATAVILGYADLAVSLQRPVGGPAAATWLPVQNHLLVAARTHGVRAIDGPWFDFRDTPSCDAANAHAAVFGFDGKWVIHPSQIAGVNEAFTPDADTVQRARRIVDAFENAGRDSVLAVDGTMVDKPVVEAAHLVLARHDIARRADEHH